MIASPVLPPPCPRCGQEISPDALQPEGSACSFCNAHVEASVLPALFREVQVAAYDPVLSGEAGCFFHPDRIAAFTCALCGRFLCPLCRIEWPGQDVCVACLEAGKSTTFKGALVSSRFHFDSLALALSTLPVLASFFSLLSAPAALGLSFVTWRRECSIVPRSKIRFFLAILFSTATIAFWVVFFLYLFRRSMRPVSVPIP